jgi:hypothetical protein
MWPLTPMRSPKVAVEAPIRISPAWEPGLDLDLVEIPEDRQNWAKWNERT